MRLATSPFWTIILVKRHAGLIVNDSLHGLTSSSQAGAIISDGFVEFTLALATSDRVTRDHCISQIEEISRNVDAQLKLYEGAIDNPQEVGNYKELVDSRMVYRKTRKQVLELLQQGKQSEAVQLYQGAGLKEFVAYKAAIDRVMEYAAAEATKRGQDIIHLCNVLMILQGLLLVFFFIYAFYVPLVTYFERTVTRSDRISDI